MKINWKQKLTSRKFWAAVVAVVMALMAVFGVSEFQQQEVNVLVWAIAALIAYILGEGLVDAARIKVSSASTTSAASTTETQATTSANAQDERKES